MALFALREGYRVDATATGGRVVHVRTGDALEVSFSEVQILARAAAGRVEIDDPSLKPLVRRLSSLGLLQRIAAEPTPPAVVQVADSEPPPPGASSEPGLWVFAPPAAEGAPAEDAKATVDAILDERPSEEPTIDFAAPAETPAPPAAEEPPVTPSPELLVPVFRSDLTCTKSLKPGVFDVADPTTGKSFAFYDFEVSIARMLNGRRSFGEVVQRANGLGIPVSLESLAQFVRQVERYGFLAPDGTDISNPPEGSIWSKREKWDEGIRSLYQSGLRLTRQGRYYEAAAYFEAILEHNPSNAEATEMLRQVQQHLADAVAPAPGEEAVVYEPEHPPAEESSVESLDFEALASAEPELPAAAAQTEVADLGVLQEEASARAQTQVAELPVPAPEAGDALLEEPPAAEELVAEISAEPPPAPPAEAEAAPAPNPEVEPDALIESMEVEGVAAEAPPAATAVETLEVDGVQPAAEPPPAPVESVVEIEPEAAPIDGLQTLQPDDAAPAPAPQPPEAESKFDPFADAPPEPPAPPPEPVALPEPPPAVRQTAEFDPFAEPSGPESLADLDSAEPSLPEAGEAAMSRTAETGFNLDAESALPDSVGFGDFSTPARQPTPAGRQPSNPPSRQPTPPPARLPTPAPVRQPTPPPALGIDPFASPVDAADPFAVQPLTLRQPTLNPFAKPEVPAAPQLTPDPFAATAPPTSGGSIFDPFAVPHAPELPLVPPPSAAPAQPEARFDPFADAPAAPAATSAPLEPLPAPSPAQPEKPFDPFADGQVAAPPAAPPAPIVIDSPPAPPASELIPAALPEESREPEPAPTQPAATEAAPAAALPPEPPTLPPVPPAAAQPPPSPVSKVLGLGVVAALLGGIWWFGLRSPTPTPPTATAKPPVVAARPAGPDAAPAVAPPAAPDVGAPEVAAADAAAAGPDAAALAGPDAAAPAGPDASAPLAAAAGPDAGPAVPKPAPSGEAGWIAVDVQRRGRVNMGDLKASSAGTVTWAVAPQDRVKKAQVVGKLVAADGKEVPLSAPNVSLIAPKVGTTQEVKEGDLLASFPYFEAYGQSPVPGAAMPAPEWACEVVDEETGEKAPCKVNKAEARKAGFYVTFTTEPLWFDTAAKVKVRLKAP